MTTIPLPNRRHFLASALSASAVGAIEPFSRTGDANLRLSLPAYSFRDAFATFKGKPRQPRLPALTMSTFIDYCRQQSTAAELTAYFFPPNADDAYFKDLKRHAHLAGVTISGTAIGNDFSIAAGPLLEQQISDAKQWLDRAAILGAPHVRLFAGTAKQFAASPQRIQNAVAALQQCANHAGRYGIFVGVENHGGITADLLLKIVKAVDSPWLGINLDTGNFHTNTPYADVAKCLPYAVNLQVKTHIKDAQGQASPSDFARLGKLLKEHRYQGFVVLEYEDDDPYGALPGLLDKVRRSLA